jgi:outer membrane protein OmpA-like peptidoglycan-associated protein
MGTTMKHRSLHGVMAALVAVSAGSAFVLGAVGPVFAQAQPTEAQILDALKPRAAQPATRGLTRSLSGGAGDPKAAEERRFIDGLRTRKTRSLSTEDRQTAAEIAKSKPKIDLEINFEYNSDRLSSESVSTLTALGRALSADGMKGTVFLINGHTDAKGSPEYNQGLSERRAEAVKRLLVDQFQLPPNTLVSIGFGKSQLKNAGDPLAAENRRVQIVNTEVR